MFSAYNAFSIGFMRSPSILGTPFQLVSKPYRNTFGESQSQTELSSRVPAGSRLEDPVGTKVPLTSTGRKGLMTPRPLQDSRQK